MPIADLDTFMANHTGAFQRPPHWFGRAARFGGSSLTLPIAGRFYTTWGQDGFRGGGVTPTASAVNPDNTTVGGLRHDNASGGRSLYIAGFTVASISSWGALLYDRLFHFGGLSASSTSLQNVGGAVNRYTGANSVGNELWIEVHTLLGVTARNLTINYVDQDGNAQTSVTQIGASGFNDLKAFFPASLAAGSTGIRSVTSVQLDNSTGATGDFAMVIARPLLLLPRVLSGGCDSMDVLDTIIPIQSGACLAIAQYAIDALWQDMFGNVVFVEG